MTRAIHSSFQETMDRYANASMPDVMVVPVRWPELHHFLDALRQLSRSYSEFASHQSVDEDLNRWFTAKRLLCTSFIQPSDPLLRLADESNWRPAVSGQLGELQQNVRNSAKMLSISEHQGIVALQNMLNGTGRLRWPKEASSARVIVQSQAIPGTTNSLAQISGAETIDWEVCTMSQAKRSGTCDITIVPGSPELQVDWRTPWEQRPRLVSWLFNAPMSQHVIAVLWPGSQPFDRKRYEPSPSSSVLDPRFSEIQDFEYDSTHWEDNIRSSSRPPSPRLDLGGEPVESIDFQLPDNYWISYGIENGPKATRIDDDSEFETDLETRLTAKQLRKGDTLVILESTASRELRRKYCSEWIGDRRLPFSPNEAQQCVDSYKKAIQIFPRDLLQIRLQSKGMTEEYIRSQIQRAFDSETIAPKRFENFEIVAQAISHDLPVHAWECVEALRGGYQHAGKVIRDLLQKAVGDDQSWQDVVASRQIAHIEVPNLGLVTLAPILAVESSVVLRHESQLGALVRV